MSRDAELTTMRLLVLIGDLGSVGKAARRLGMAQSNASRALARYERVTGLHLVDRSASGSRLSPHGELVATWAEEALRAVDDFTHAVASLRAEVGGHLAVGASQTIAEYLAPRWLARFRIEHPEVEVTLKVANSEDTLHALPPASSTSASWNPRRTSPASASTCSSAMSSPSSSPPATRGRGAPAP